MGARLERSASGKFRNSLLNRKMLLGSWIQSSDPLSAEILADVGFSWLAVDLEHSGIDTPQLMQLLRGMHGRGVVPLARVRENDALAIRQALDVGAGGVIVPLVHSAAEAERAVAAAKYPPAGIRGFCYSRMNGWGGDFDSYAASANEDVSVIVMIESRQAVEEIDGILAVPGVDAVFIGPYDMSGSYGVPGRIQHPIVEDACLKVLERCQRAGKAAGLHVVKAGASEIASAVARGYSFLALGADIVFLRKAALEAMEAAKKGALDESAV